MKPQGQVDLINTDIYISKVNAIANGKTTCTRFRLPKGKTWYISAYKDDTKDRKRVRATRPDGNSVYLKPHTIVVVE